MAEESPAAPAGDIWPMTPEETRGFTLFGQSTGSEGILRVTAVGYDGPVVEVPIHGGFFSKSECMERVLHQTFFQQDGNCRYLCLPEASYMPYIPWLLRFLNVPNSFDLDMATYRRPMEDCLDLTLCADFLQIPEPWWTMFYEHMTAKFSGRAIQLAESKVWSRILLLPPKDFDAWMQVLDPHPAALEAVLRYFYRVGDTSGPDRDKEVDPPDMALLQPPAKEAAEDALSPAIGPPVESDADQRTLDILRRLFREAPRSQEIDIAVQCRLDAMMKRQKVPRGTPALKEHTLAFQAGWPREGTQASKLADALVWNLITAQLCLREVASLQVACSGFEGRVRFLVSYWLQTLPPGHLRHVIAMSHVLPSGVSHARAVHRQMQGFPPRPVAPRILQPPMHPRLRGPGTADASDNDDEVYDATDLATRRWQNNGPGVQSPAEEAEMLKNLKFIGLVILRPAPRLRGRLENAGSATFIPRIVRMVLGGSPLEHLEDRKGIVECVQRRLAWARLAAHTDRLVRNEKGEVEPKQFDLDEVEADLALLRALSTEESAEKQSDGSVASSVKATYAEMLPAEHPARGQYQ
jgi:hypothetical protein